MLNRILMFVEGYSGLTGNDNRCFTGRPGGRDRVPLDTKMDPRPTFLLHDRCILLPSADGGQLLTSPQTFSH